jgi:ABC-type methionine transport system ATPase subunit
MLGIIEKEFAGYTILLITHQVEVVKGKLDKTLGFVGIWSA